MKKTLRCYFLLTALLAAAAFQGCSSSEVSEGDVMGDDTQQQANASTDPVPPSGDLDQVASADGAPPADTMGAATPSPDASGTPPPVADAAAPGAAQANQDPLASLAPPPAPTSDAQIAQNTPPPAVAPATTPPPADSTPPPIATADTSNSGKSASPEGDSEYTVHSGDTLMKIAFEQYGDIYKWKSIYEANKDKISNPNSIPRGTVLRIDRSAGNPPAEPSGEKYLIKQGDTLGTIANNVYGTPSKWKKIWKHNRSLIKDPNRIFAGFYLYYTLDPGEGGGSNSMSRNDTSTPPSAGPASGSDDTALRSPASMTAPSAAPTTPSLAPAGPAPVISNSPGAGMGGTPSAPAGTLPVQGASH